MAVPAPACLPFPVWLFAHGCPCSCLPSIPRFGSLPMAVPAPAYRPSPAAALCPWLPLHGCVMLRLSALPCPDGAKLFFPAPMGQSCSSLPRRGKAVLPCPDGAKVVKCAAQPIMMLVSCCCCVPCYCRVPDGCAPVVVVRLLLSCGCCCRAAAAFVRLLLCACCCTLMVLVLCCCRAAAAFVCLLLLYACCVPVVVVRLVGCVGVLFASCLRPVCVLFASSWFCPVGRLLSCGCCCRAPFVWLLVCLFWGSLFFLFRLCINS